MPDRSMKPLRWHAWVRTTNGHISSYVRVRAWSLEDAAKRAQKKAYKRWLEEHTEADRKMMPHPLEDWRVHGVSLHEGDVNRLHELR